MCCCLPLQDLTDIGESEAVSVNRLTLAHDVRITSIPTAVPVARERVLRANC